MNTSDNKADLTLDEVAQALNCDRSHVWRLRFELRAFNIGSGKRAAWRVRREALEAFRKAREVAPAS